ncbi:hypothetical protein BJF83_20230 [Nocardiopsis sp. CNR-923]|uniref:hypothetical protein n=1 Tax=Nocardiopsis sp. CNR-923 TaxID=1904965 RepID=UPI00095D7AB9|nr:hypothetical protein [Nocardiopsis sp. CNR-923]OLT26835.1 hypothetical protein BJF83_20230 [Nocardiopsis sp. CNR-923]
MNDPAATGARAAAERLSAFHGPQLITDVEAALHARDTDQIPDRFLDPVAVAALIVAAATLSWTVYNDLKTRTSAAPTAQVVTRTVTTRLRRTRTLTREETAIVTTTVEETLTPLDQHTPGQTGT